MAPNTLAMAKAAAKSNNISQLRIALDAWLAEENPEPPRSPKWPMASFQNHFQEALRRGNLEVAKELLKRGCVVDNWAPLCATSPCKEESGWDTRALELLLQHGWDVNAHLNHAGYPLRNAVFDENIPLIIWLLQNGANPNENSKEEPFDTPLAVAAGWSTLEIFRLLLKNGAEGGIKAAFLTAADHGRCDILQVLLDEGVDVNCTVTKEENPYRRKDEPEENGNALHYAAMGGNPSVIEFLLEKGGDSEAKTPGGMTPREVAEKRGSSSCASLLP